MGARWRGRQGKPRLFGGRGDEWLRPHRVGLRRSMGAVLLAAGITGLLLVALARGWLDYPEMSLLDWRLQVRGLRPAPPELLIVALDDRTMSHARRLSPVPRDLLAAIVRRLAAAHARTIVLDVLLQDPGPPDEDQALQEALAEAGNVILPAELDGNRSVRLPAPPFRDVAAGVGLAHLESASADQVVRWERPMLHGIPSLALAAGAHFRDLSLDSWPQGCQGKLGAKPDTEGRLLIDFVGPPGSIAHVSAADLLQGRLTPGAARDKLVLIGGVWADISDQHFVPLGRPGAGPEGHVMSGVELQAQCLASLLNRSPLQPVSPQATAVGLLTTLSLVSLIVLHFPPTPALLLSLGLGTLWLAEGVWLFTRQHLYIPLAPPLFGIAAAYLASALVTERRARHLRRHFRRYVGQALADRIAEMSDREIGRMGQERVVTLLFSDIRGYTRWSQERPPEAIVAFLNRYFERMAAAALAHDGFVDKYIGDGLMALFGLFSRDESGAAGAGDAVRAAVAMRTALDELRRQEPEFRSIAMGVGLHTGRVLVGDLGPPDRTDFTAIGSPVNLAARIEAETKGVLAAHRQRGADPAAVILMSDVTYRLVADQVRARALGPAVIRGLEEEEVRLWELDEAAPSGKAGA